MNQNQNKRGLKPLPEGKRRITRSITMSPEVWERLAHLQRQHFRGKSRSWVVEHFIAFIQDNLEQE
jgi:predicted DNA-binding protein